MSERGQHRGGRGGGRGAFNVFSSCPPYFECFLLNIESHPAKFKADNGIR
jgi:hypothetical protein